MKKKSRKVKINCNLLSPTEIFKLVLTGKLKRFPPGFWNGPDGVINGVEILRYFIEEKLGWTENDIKEKINCELFFNNKLSGLLVVLYHGSIWPALNAAYPDRFKEWELPVTPSRFWNEERGIRATKWMIEEKLMWTDDDIKERTTARVFLDNGLDRMLHILYHSRPWYAINAAYPNRFKVWELPVVPAKFWNEETGILATKWMIEEKLKWSENDIKVKISKQVFIEYKLAGMLSTVYHNTAWKAINAAYPNRFKEWELKKTPRNFWNEETAIRAIKWLIEEKLKWNDAEVKEHIRSRTFIANGLATVIDNIFAGPYQALNAAYPGRFRKEDLKGFMGKSR